MHAVAGHIEKEIARNGEHAHGFGRRIDGHHDIGLGEWLALKFLVVIAAQEEDIDAALIRVARCSSGAGRLLAYDLTEGAREGRVEVGDHPSKRKEKHDQNDQDDVRAP